MMDAVVRAAELRKSFGTVTAVDGLSFAVRQGELFGLIGPDGAGKTTLLRMLVTLLRPDSGSMTVKGFDVAHDLRQIRSIVGYMPQRFSLYPDLSVDQNLHFFADLFGVPKSEIKQRKQRLYAFSRLEEFAHRLAGRLSGGMKQKLALSCTLIHDPLLLVLDEPTTGVDPVSRVEFWNILRELRGQGVTIIVSTPYMDEALLCDRVIVLHEGRALAEGTPAELIDLHPHRVFSIQSGIPGLSSAALEAIPGVMSVQSFGDSLHLTTDIDTVDDELSAALRQLANTDVHPRSIEASFEDVFISLIMEDEAHV